MKTPDLKEKIGTPFRCSDNEHYFASEHIPNFPIWIRKCMTCGFYDTRDMNEQLDKLVAQKQIEARIDELEKLLKVADGEFSISLSPYLKRPIKDRISELKSLTKAGEL